MLQKATENFTKTKVLKTYQIHIEGIVQGVGFRPFVYQLAKKMHLKGYVCNGGNGVNIIINAEAEMADLFYNRIKQLAPSKAVILRTSKQEIEYQTYLDFSIQLENVDNKKKSVLISPDIAICDNCRAEFHNSTNRRYHYAFITCTQCGPRYSIINKLPYERYNTSMDSFTPCPDCNSEYQSVSNKRFFSQTNSCKTCGITLNIWENKSLCISDSKEEVLIKINTFLRQGKILAIKGTCGYLLVIDANNIGTISRLRDLKKRPNKPLAVLYPDIKLVHRDFYLRNKEKELLQSTAAPIVVLYPKSSAFNHIKINQIANGLNRVGVMIPSNPLFNLIALNYGSPLVATSANISGSPIIYEDSIAFDELFNFADYLVSHNCEIVVPLDDSVVQVSKFSNQPIIIRRSRGYAPTYLNYFANPSNTILATGAHLKSSFALNINENMLISQFLGSGESYNAQTTYIKTLQHCLKLYNIKPKTIIADKHQGYFTHQYAKELANNFGADIKLVQHHESHFAAVLAENSLIDHKEPILGVIWDGTGLGVDGNIWGGEFFKYKRNKMERVAHFNYFPTIAGDKTALEPRLSALCATNGSLQHRDLVFEKFTKTELFNYLNLINQATLFTSSVGRIFDAVAALLGLCDEQSYEGEAALYLQTLAENYVLKHGFFMDSSYFEEEINIDNIPTYNLLQGILNDIGNNKPKDYIAAKFHFTMVQTIGIVAKTLDIHKICFSGGVFQNVLLVDWIKHKYEQNYKLYFHINLSPNDENISFGQFVYHENKIDTKLKSNIKNRPSTSHSKSINNQFNQPLSVDYHY